GRPSPVEVNLPSRLTSVGSGRCEGHAPAPPADDRTEWGSTLDGGRNRRGNSTELRSPGRSRVTTTRTYLRAVTAVVPAITTLVGESRGPAAASRRAVRRPPKRPSGRERRRRV